MSSRDTRHRVIVLCGAALLGSGCSTTTVVITPIVDVVPTVEALRIRGTIEYAGNREYLPRTVADEPSASGLTFRFGYAVKTDADRTSIYGAVFIPPVILAIPGVLGGDEVAVAAILEVLRGGSVIKAYSATAVVKKKPTIFDEGDTFTEMRRRGLLVVRETIDRQMSRDREALQRLAAE